MSKIQSTFVTLDQSRRQRSTDEGAAEVTKGGDDVAQSSLTPPVAPALPCLKSLGYICSKSQKYIVWVKIIDFSFMPKIIRTLSKDHVP